MDLDGAANALHRGLAITRLERDHSQQMQAVRVIGVDGKDLVVPLLCLNKPSLLVVLECPIEHHRNAGIHPAVFQIE
jgi:hypothetical protein